MTSSVIVIFCAHIFSDCRSQMVSLTMCNCFTLGIFHTLKVMNLLFERTHPPLLLQKLEVVTVNMERFCFRWKCM